MRLKTMRLDEHGPPLRGSVVRTRCSWFDQVRLVIRARHGTAGRSNVVRALERALRSSSAVKTRYDRVHAVWPWRCRWNQVDSLVHLARCGPGRGMAMLPRFGPIDRLCSCCRSWSLRAAKTCQPRSPYSLHPLAPPSVCRRGRACSRTRRHVHNCLPDKHT